MKFRLALTLFVVSLSCTACAAFQKVEPFLPSPNQISCIEVEVDNGTPALDIVVKCQLASNALAFVESLMIGHKQAKAIQLAAAAHAADGGAQ